jgi:Uma2 family endonuclease
MTAMITPTVYYPSGDGEPVAETFDHLYAILITIELLRLYLQDVQACVLGNQFLYYEEGNALKRCAPDVMVIFGVEPGSRDNYKIWEEGRIPTVVFEMTSRGTKQNDEVDKKQLYAEIGIEEYWQFDPKGEWISEQLRGFRWVGGEYRPIVNSTSTALGLRLEVTGALISFYRSDNGEKLLTPSELQEKAELEQEKLKLEQARSQELEARSQELEIDLRSQNQALQEQLDRYRDRFGEL